MHIVIQIILVGILQWNKVSCQLEYGGVFPIPLSTPNEDPNFHECPIENTPHTHTTNCSLFHLCSFGTHRIYSCNHGFFFDPARSRCEFLPLKKEVNCEVVLQKLTDKDFYPFIEPLAGYYFHYERKSATSKCTHTGFYADILDCSLFHYCHKNNHHEILKCPHDLHFDPKTLLCLPIQLVNCQYEPSRKRNYDIDTICRGHASATYLPLPDRFDKFIICKSDGKNLLANCEPGLIYNALTTTCEKGPCTFDSTLCKNEGQCIDEPTNEKGFKCICSSRFQGDFCEQDIGFEQTTEQNPENNSIKQNTENFIPESNYNDTTHIPYIYEANGFRTKKHRIKVQSSTSVVQNKSLINSKQKQQYELILKIIFTVITTLMCLFVLASTVRGLVVVTRLILDSSRKTVNEWKTLHEESNI